MAGRRKNKAVTDVAEGIGIDPNASPEQAALEEAAQTGAAAQAAAVDATTPPIDPEAQAPDMTEESPTPGESEGLPAEPTSGVEVVSPGGEPPVAPVREKLPAGEGVEERLNPTPAAPLAAETKKAAKDHAAAVRESRKVESPSLKRLGAMGKKLPGAEHIKIYKRDERRGERLRCRVRRRGDSRHEPKDSARSAEGDHDQRHVQRLFAEGPRTS